MRASRPDRTLAVLGLLLLGPALADDERPAFRPGYERDGARREAFRGPPEVALPDDLRLTVPAGSEQPSQGLGDDGEGEGEVRTLGRAGDRRPGPDGERDRRAGDGVDERRSGFQAEMDRRAVLAARWAAEEIAESFGGREYYRTGVHRGLRSALNDPRLGEWDYLQGVRLGRRDPEARRIGFDVGADAARDAARADAEAQVADQYRDLAREPRRSPRFAVPRWTTGGSWAAPVTLREVFETHPPRMFPGLGGRLALAFDDWRYDPWGLYACEGHVEFYDAGWKDPHRAFEFWKDRRADRWYLRLNRAERIRFREVFEAEFAHRIPSTFRRHLASAFDRGFEDGWSYGAFLGYEWHFRRGYNEGFDLAVGDAAERGFGREYGAAYTRFYDDAFEQWATSARPGIVAVELLDGNDDGVFEPGETVLARFEAANYGGRAGGFATSIDGEILEGSARDEVRLPARAVTSGQLDAFARIDPRTAVHTRSEVTFSLAGLTRPVPVRVSYPLEFASAPAIEHIDALAGTMVVSARVVNASRRGVSGGVTLTGVSGYDHTDEVELGTLDPGRQRQVTFAVEGLRSLDLLAGRPSVRLEAHDGERLHDGRTIDTPNLSLDLGDRALVRFLVALARDRNASPRDIEQAQGLVLDRLRVDWNEAVRGRGNPYKEDRRKGTTSTALGDLVRTYERERGSMLRPEVFEDLQIEIIELSDGLPGAHPFLRKQMKRLARDLG